MVLLTRIVPAWFSKSGSLPESLLRGNTASDSLNRGKSRERRWKSAKISVSTLHGYEGMEYSLTLRQKICMELIKTNINRLRKFLKIQINYIYQLRVLSKS
jgi:hypothetical protein